MKKLIIYLQQHSLLNEGQHGFRRDRSCLSQLLEHYEALVNALENRETADVVYLNLAKAFDKVDNGMLIRKLKKLGIGGLVLKWIHEFP